MSFLSFLDDDYGRMTAKAKVPLAAFPDAPPAFIQGYKDEISKMHAELEYLLTTTDIENEVVREYDNVHSSVFDQKTKED